MKNFRPEEFEPEFESEFESEFDSDIPRLSSIGGRPSTACLGRGGEISVFTVDHAEDEELTEQQR